MADSILEVVKLVKKYPAFSLKEVSFSLPRGYIMGFAGQNGAGKSTTIRCLLGIEKYDSGNIRIFGQDIHLNALEIRQKIGYVSEEFYYYDDMTVSWTGKFVGRFYKNWDAALYESFLRQFGIDSKKKIKELSKGTKMKLSLALALSHRPELLILDEPTSGLDPVARDNILRIFLDLMQDENRSILFSSHITSDIEKVADYITVIDEGSIIMSEEKNNLLDSWHLVKTENSRLISELSSMLLGIKYGPHGVSGITKDIGSFTKKFNEKFPGKGFVADKITIDELLVRIARQKENDI